MGIKSKMKSWMYILILCITSFGLTSAGQSSNTERDSFNGVVVYDNGNNFRVSSGRNVSKDGYNLGMKWQCVEYVKRYYYQQLNHKMPNSWGHAFSFYNKSLVDGKFNKDRGLMQFSNPSSYKPKVDDIVVYDGYPGNSYGHVAIITKVEKDYIEVIQQNTPQTRSTIKLEYSNNKIKLNNKYILGWLRK